MQEEKSIDDDNKGSIKSSKSNTNARKTQATREEEGCIGGRKDSSILAGRGKEKRSLIIAKHKKSRCLQEDETED